MSNALRGAFTLLRRRITNFLFFYKKFVSFFFLFGVIYMKLTNIITLNKILILAILLFGSFFIVWFLNIIGLYDLIENTALDSFSSPYSITQ
jgi:hypothetical protein